MKQRGQENQKKKKFENVRDKVLNANSSMEEGSTGDLQLAAGQELYLLNHNILYDR